MLIMCKTKSNVLIKRQIFLSLLLVISISSCIADNSNITMRPGLFRTSRDQRRRSSLVPPQPGQVPHQTDGSSPRKRALSATLDPKTVLQVLSGSGRKLSGPNLIVPPSLLQRRRSSGEKRTPPLRRFNTMQDLKPSNIAWFAVILTTVIATVVGFSLLLRQYFQREDSDWID